MFIQIFILHWIFFVPSSAGRATLAVATGWNRWFFSICFFFKFILFMFFFGKNDLILFQKTQFSSHFDDRNFWKSWMLLLFATVQYVHFFLKGFVEDLLDAFWSENSVFGFFWENFFGDRIFWQNCFYFYFCRLCVIL